MATVHPKPKLVYLRDDGFGGLDLCITTSTGHVEVHPLKPSDAARWIEHLAVYAALKLRDSPTRAG